MREDLKKVGKWGVIVIKHIKGCVAMFYIREMQQWNHS